MNDRGGITNKSDNSHEEIKQTALKRDEEQVQAIVNHLNQTMTDPFDIDAHPPCLINISTGMHATREVQDSLRSAVNEGENMCRKFVNSALSLDQSGSFYSPITKRALALANSRDDVTIDSILSLPLGPIPVSLFQSDLVKQFENEVSPVLSMPDFDPSVTTYIRDGSFEDPEIAKVISDQEVVQLFSTQEEADTRMILQALHADRRLKEFWKERHDYYKII
ncbi:unnamed protein product [Mytilus coruscus]|uniref:Uncharacterized protein n=1 Tax=Mytilus coruscus TaxID=42192 RepID=A0A6J8A1M2_MYTCO|nr:unnamed protein product [Mytilus coruscus]